MRSACASIGYFAYKSVFEANVLLERTLLHLLVVFQPTKRISNVDRFTIWVYQNSFVNPSKLNGG